MPRFASKLRNSELWPLIAGNMLSSCSISRAFSRAPSFGNPGPESAPPRRPGGRGMVPLSRLGQEHVPRICPSLNPQNHATCTAGAPQLQLTSPAPQLQLHSCSSTAPAPQLELHSSSSTTGAPQLQLHSWSTTAQLHSWSNTAPAPHPMNWSCSTWPCQFGGLAGCMGGGK